VKRQTAYIVGGIGVGVVLWIVGVPGWLIGLLILAAIAAPVVGYAILDPSQKRRLKGLARKQIGPGNRR
jgi:cell division protein FtsW (lipid II flippase)